MHRHISIEIGLFIFACVTISVYNMIDHKAVYVRKSGIMGLWIYIRIQKQTYQKGGQYDLKNTFTAFHAVYQTVLNNYSIGTCDIP